MSFYNPLDSSQAVVEITGDSELSDAFAFMSAQGLFPDTSVDFLLGMKRDNRIVATGGASGSVIKFLCVDPALQGEGIAARIVTEIIERLSLKEVHHYFVYTKPEVALLLESMGFTEVASVKDKAVLLEGGIGSVSNWLKSLETFPSETGKAAAVVVNGNPLTLGHLHLLKTAREEEGALHVLVVSTDQSLFPASVRMKIIREATADWGNTIVHEAGEYIVSMATFPSYFTRKEEVAYIQASLDIEVFGRHIVPALSIGSRYVGEEPYCSVTALYNKAMKERLAAYGVRFVEIPRIESAASVISASMVRKMLKDGVEPSSLENIVPEATINFLLSQKGGEIIEKIRKSTSRH